MLICKLDSSLEDKASASESDDPLLPSRRDSSEDSVSNTRCGAPLIRSCAERSRLSEEELDSEPTRVGELSAES